MNNPYVRSKLQATNSGEIDPEVEVDLIFGRLRGVLEGEYDDDLEQKSFHLLSLWAAACRFDPKLASKFNGYGIIEEAQLLLEATPALWAQYAMAIIDPQAWYVAAREHSHSFDKDVDASSISENACDLYVDLDEAELAMYAIGRLTPLDNPDRLRMSRSIQNCANFLNANIGDYLAAGVYAQAVGHAIRPDLAQFEPLLARTADKYIRLLDEVEAMEEEMVGDGIGPMDEATYRGLREVFRSKVAPSVASYKFPTPMRRAAVAAHADNPDRLVTPIRTLRWRSPDGEFQAIYDYGEYADPDVPLSIEFIAATGSISALRGQFVYFHGCQSLAPIDGEGIAEFSLSDLLKSERPPTLAVNDPEQYWILEQPPNAD